MTTAISDITYTWQVNELVTADLQGYTDVVTVVHWTLVGTVGTTTAQCISATELDLGESLVDIRAFEGLTEAEVTAWILANESEERLEYYFNRVRDRIDEQSIISARVQAAPWAPVVLEDGNTASISEVAGS